MRSTIEGAMKKVFRPEFLNRIDEVIIFNELEKEHIMTIIDLNLKSVFHRIEEKGYMIELSQSAKEFIADKGFDKQFGARPLQRALQKYLEDPIADKILSGETSVGDTLFVDYAENDEQVSVEVKKNESLPEPPAEEEPKEEGTEES